MCLLVRASGLGANVLPFGLMSEVSASALAAGAGGLSVAGEAAGAAGGVSAFARELGALGENGQQAAAGDGQSPAGGLPVSGDAPIIADAEDIKLPLGAEAVAAQQVASMAKQAGEILEDAPGVASDGPVEDAAAALLDEASAQAEAAPGPAVPPAQDTEALAEDVADIGNTADAAGAGDAADAAAIEIPALAPVVPGPGASDAAGQPIPPVSGEVPGVRVAAAVSAVAGGLDVPGLSRADFPGKPAQAAQEGLAGQAAEKGQPGTVPPPASNARRWQSELPEEFRAPKADLGQKQGPGQQAASAPAQANGNAVTLAEASKALVEIGVVSEKAAAANEAKPATELARPVAVAPQGAEPAEAVAAAAKTVPGLAVSQENKTDGQKQALAARSAAAPAAGQAVNNPGEGVKQPLPPVAAAQGNLQEGEGLLPPKPFPDGEPDAGRAVSGLSPEIKSGGQQDGTAASQPATANAGAGQEQRPANAGPVAAPLAGETAQAPEIVPEDSEPFLKSTDVSFSGELGAATVRGGDLAGAMRTESLQAPNQTQSAHVASQVAAEISRNLKNGQTRFQMRFDPPELGRVEVKMKVGSDGNVHAHLIVDRPETLDMFLRDQRGLERALQTAGLNPDSDNLQFSLKQDGGQQFSSGGGEQGQSFDGQERADAGVAETDPELESIVRLALAEQRGGLDLKI